MSSDPRTAIRDAAGEVFARYGFKKASVEDIARRAGVGKGSIYLHFESKEALFEACVRNGSAQARAELEAVVRRAESPELQVRAFINTKLEQITRLRKDPRLQVETLFELGAQAMHLVPEEQQKDAAILARVLADGVEQGVFAVEDPSKVAIGLVETLAGLTIGLVTRANENPTWPALDAYFDIFIRGLAAPHTKPHSRK